MLDSARRLAFKPSRALRLHLAYAAILVLSYLGKSTEKSSLDTSFALCFVPSLT
jgi:hypothetical protein